MNCAEQLKIIIAALKEISNLKNMKEIRGPLEDIGVDGDLVKPGGWVPIHPRTLQGLCLAAKIADKALDEIGIKDEA